MKHHTFISNIILIVAIVICLAFPARAENEAGPGTPNTDCVLVEEYKHNEYPVACEIWIYLKEQGFNDWVAAGILGNMMNEAGGNTLDIKIDALSKHKTYYGICQWNKKVYRAVWYQDLDYQLDFLMQTIEQEFIDFGRRYSKGFSYSDFMNLTDEKEAALAFSKVYERNYANSYKARMRNATKAYDYFVSQ